MYIEDGKGKGNNVEVNDSNQMSVIAEIHELQHHNSAQHGEVYQATTQMTATSGTNNVLYLENENVEIEFAISYIRLQTIDLAGGTALPSKETYFQLGFDNTYTSGGVGLTPINMNRGSANAADVAAYGGGPTLAGDFIEVDRWYVDGDGKMMSYNKHGSIIIPKNKAFIVRLVTDHSSGDINARTTFMFLK